MGHLIILGMLCLLLIPLVHRIISILGLSMIQMCFTPARIYIQIELIRSPLPFFFYHVTSRYYCFDHIRTKVKVKLHWGNHSIYDGVPCTARFTSWLSGSLLHPSPSHLVPFEVNHNPHFLFGVWGRAVMWKPTVHKARRRVTQPRSLAPKLCPWGEWTDDCLSRVPETESLSPKKPSRESHIGKSAWLRFMRVDLFV